MIRYAVSAGLVAVRVASVRPAHRRKPTPHWRSSELPGIVESAMQQTGVPGVAVAVVHNDQVIYSQGFGCAARRPTSRSPPTVFQFGLQFRCSARPLSQRRSATSDSKWTGPDHEVLPKFTFIEHRNATKNVTVADMHCTEASSSGSVGNDPSLRVRLQGDHQARLRYELLSPFRVTAILQQLG